MILLLPGAGAITEMLLLEMLLLPGITDIVVNGPAPAPAVRSFVAWYC